MPAPSLPRLYEPILRRHFASARQMAFVSGPRQVGKSTLAKGLADHYLSMDFEEDRRRLLLGQRELFESLGPAAASRPTLALDELHKIRHWKRFLKGFFDRYEDRLRVLVTGSSRLDIYRRGGDSMMGRYFPFRMHPLSVAELCEPSAPDQPLRPPRRLSEEAYAALWRHGGFPEPFLVRQETHTRQWRQMRRQLLLREDLRDLTRTFELSLLEKLLHILESRSAAQLSYTKLAQALLASVDSARRWVALLCDLHHGFLLRPWSFGITHSLRKEPKWYLRDWSGVEDEGARFETFLAAHLLKAVEGWTDLGLGDFALHYLRDKEKREVDFLVTRGGQPWILAEAKSSDGHLSPSLAHFQKKTGAPHAFVVVAGMDFKDEDCFRAPGLRAVPARTFLSQLL